MVVHALAQKKHLDYDQFFSGLENYVLVYPNTKLVYHESGTDEPFTVAKYKKELSKPYSKICFFLCKDEEYPSSLLKKIADSVKYINFCDVHHVYLCRFCKSIIFTFVMYIMLFKNKLRNKFDL